jgi:hypothetical protein
LRQRVRRRAEQEPESDVRIGVKEVQR